MKEIKVLNGYAGIGGNRALWPKNCEVTAVENKPSVAAIYKELYPQDKVIVADVKKYIVKNYKKFDFIWLSPVCRSHSKTMFFNHVEKKVPDLSMYEEILFFKHFYYGKYVVENVHPYYKPLIEPQKVDRHCFWANFHIPPIKIGEKVKNDRGNGIKEKMKARNIEIKDWHGFTGDKRQLLNNMIYPKLGLHVFNAAFKNEQKVLV